MSVDTTADRYFFEAKAKAAQKQWVDSLVLFEKAWEIKPSHDIAGNLGQVALKLGRYKKAAIFLERCLRLFPPTGNADQRTQIQTLFESARAHVAQVKILVLPQAGELVIDRATVIGPVATPAEPVFVDPGTHILQIRRDGKVVGETSFLAIANAFQDVTVTANDSRSEGTVAAGPGVNTESNRYEPATSTPEKAESTHARSAWPIVVGVTVSVVGFVSAGFLFRAAANEADSASKLRSDILSNSRASANDLCGTGTSLVSECQDLLALNERADTRYNWGYAMIGVGGAALVSTLGYALWPSSSSRGQSGLVTSRRSVVGFDLEPRAGHVRYGFRF